MRDIMKKIKLGKNAKHLGNGVYYLDNDNPVDNKDSNIAEFAGLVYYFKDKDFYLYLSHITHIYDSISVIYDYIKPKYISGWRALYFEDISRNDLKILVEESLIYINDNMDLFKDLNHKKVHIKNIEKTLSDFFNRGYKF